ncbi:ribosome small subunit-dependent GTPase A [Bacillus sp. B1-b2]|uniref:ribosome small subunit-dependent GTPase A n=1 Tax=Bacillus sp. B1-b2 TaxID=2653201 RepID=UPI001261A72F|nr:ribosome small subunit-dependent GTPase A [Bacillus sp. B1-b2]KAB7673029.1 ribosome small subunit-dependent GTPase A [Bacillus sp. B1-b2]
MDLITMGYNDTVKEAFTNLAKKDEIVGRVTLEHKRMYRVWSEAGELLCEVSGKLSFQAMSREDYPAVGDWVILLPRANEGKGTITGILPRISKFSRKVAGDNTEEQIVAANVDTIFLVNSLNEDLNVRRLERYLTLTWEGGANPVIILTKADLVDNLEEKKAMVEGIAFGVPVIMVSVVEQVGIERLQEYLLPGKTVALLGSSGVGKSTLTNFLLGYEKQEVQHIRESDAKGRHTTTHREMVLLPNQAILIDTPGMRELQLWNSESGLSTSFSDIEKLGLTCRFRDCTHKAEAGCAVKRAIELGEMEEERLISYNKLLRELAYLERKQSKRAQAEEKKKWKMVNQQRKGK